MESDKTDRFDGMTGCRLWIACLLAILSACSANKMVPPVKEHGLSIQAPSTSDLSTIHFTVQVGAFTTTQRAARYADLLSTDGLDAYYFIDDDGLCKVRFEKFDTKAAARRRALALVDKGIIESFYIVNPRHDGIKHSGEVDLQRDIIVTARRFIGTPYRWGGTSVKTGFDCSGLTMTVYRLNGLDLPRNAASQFSTGRPVQLKQIRKGDLVFFSNGRSSRISHVGIYSGDGEFIHAPGTGKRIRFASLSNTYFKAR